MHAGKLLDRLKGYSGRCSRVSGDPRDVVALAEEGVAVSRESTDRWCNAFAPPPTRDSRAAKACRARPDRSRAGTPIQTRPNRGSPP